MSAMIFNIAILTHFIRQKSLEIFTHNKIKS